MLSFVTAFDKQAHEYIIRFISKEKCKLDVPAMRFVFQKKNQYVYDGFVLEWARGSLLNMESKTVKRTRTKQVSTKDVLSHEAFVLMALSASWEHFTKDPMNITKAINNCYGIRWRSPQWTLKF